MSTIPSPAAGPQLLQRWRRQVAGQHRRRELAGTRQYAANELSGPRPARSGID